MLLKEGLLDEEANRQSLDEQEATKEKIEKLGINCYDRPSNDDFLINIS